MMGPSSVDQRQPGSKRPWLTVASSRSTVAELNFGIVRTSSAAGEALEQVGA